jgi:hypothetical protein
MMAFGWAVRLSWETLRERREASKMAGHHSRPTRTSSRPVVEW